MEYVPFCVWHPSLSIMVSRIIQCCTIFQYFAPLIGVFHYCSISFYVYATFSLAIHLLMDIWIALPLSCCE